MMLLRLFWEFFKIGLFAVGGGMATIPFLYDLSDRTGWFTYTQLADMIAISESTPGPIGVNMATYVGYEMSGFLAPFLPRWFCGTLHYHHCHCFHLPAEIPRQPLCGKRLLRSAAGFLRAHRLGSALGSHCGTAGRWLELWYPVAEHPLAGGGAGGVFGHRDQPKADQKVAPPLCSWAFPLWWVLCSTLRGL